MRRWRTCYRCRGEALHKIKPHKSLVKWKRKKVTGLYFSIFHWEIKLSLNQIERLKRISYKKEKKSVSKYVRNQIRAPIRAFRFRFFFLLPVSAAFVIFFPLHAHVWRKATYLQKNKRYKVLRENIYMAYIISW